MDAAFPGPSDFCLRVFPSDDRFDSVFGTVDEVAKDAYLSAFDVARLLRVKDAPGFVETLASCRYGDLRTNGNRCSDRKRRLPLIESRRLTEFLTLRTTRIAETELLRSVLQGPLRVQARGVHSLRACGCAQLRGCPFQTWIRKRHKFAFRTAHEVRPRKEEETYPAPFRIRIHDAFDDRGSVLLTVGRESELYVSSYDVGRLLGETNPFAYGIKNQTHRLKDASAVPPDPHQDAYSMMDERTATTLLETAPSLDAEKLCELLRGRRNVKYEGVIHRHHVLNCCACAQVDGVPFDAWLALHQTRLLSEASVPHSAEKESGLRYLTLLRKTRDSCA